MTPEQIRHIRDLLQSDKPRDAALVREMLAVLGVPADDIARLTGRLSILIFHEVSPLYFHHFINELSSRSRIPYESHFCFVFLCSQLIKTRCCW